MFGVLAENLVGRCGFDLIHPDDLDRALAELSSGLAVQGSPVNVEFRLNDPRGRLRWVEEIITDFTRDPDVGFVVGNLRDITERKVAEGAMTRLALVDDLTGLPNRTALVEAVRNSEGNGDRLRHVGLVLFDLDDFCDVNDTLGHGVGDALLIAVARRVQAALPADHLLARSSGDQFAVLSASPSNLQTCRGLARRVQASLSTPLAFEGHELMVSATSGLALAPSGRIKELIRHADAALSEAKKTGRGGTVVYRPELEDQAANRLRRTGDLRLAVNRHEIVPHYQPVIDLESGRVVAAEALARWKHPEAGWSRPDEFMPLAETTGLIGQLGEQLITQLALTLPVGFEWVDGSRWPSTRPVSSWSTPRS